MTDSPSITLLHLSDPQFGPKHRFSGTGHDTLFGRLCDDFEAMRARHGLVPDLVLITGDLVETGKPSEFRQFRQFAETLTDYFGLPRRRLVLIPGNHDISRAASEAYFKQCEADEVEPRQPYWPKLEHYARMFAEFYAGEPGLTFTEAEPYTLYEYPDLKLVVAGLNSTIADSHRPDDHHGFLGETQLRHFAGKLRTFAEQDWLRIAAVHHNPYPTGNSTHDIKDLADLKRFLRPYLNLVVHGHVHEESLEWLAKNIPVLGIGSAGVDLKQRPPEVPNQYQWIRVSADRLAYGSRAYIPDQKRWIDDLRADADGSQWWQTEGIDFERVTATFAPASSTPTAPAPEDLLAHAISRHRAAIARQSRHSIRLYDLATYGEDSGIPPLDLLKIFIPQQALREVPSRDRAPWEPEPERLPPQEIDFKPEAGQAPRSIETILAGGEHPWALILGSPGAGKSTLTHWVVLKLSAEGESLGDLPHDLVPVRVDLRLFAERRSAALKAGESQYNALDYLGGLHHDYPQHLGRDPLQILADAGRLFWIFDGLDEVADARLRDEIAAMIVEVRQQYGGHGLITGRIVGCRELQPRFHAGDIHCFTLRDFDPSQIDEFLDRWHALAFPGAPDVAAGRRARLRKLLAENHTLRDLCGNPLLLTLIALLNRGDELPRRRYQLLERAAELMLGQWDANRGLPPATRFDLGVKRRYLAELAWHMLTELPGGAGNIIPSDALHRFTARFAQRHLSANHDTADSTARALIKHLRERNYVLGFLGGDSFGFLHKAFFEYFSAFEIVSRFHNHDLSLEDIARLLAQHWHRSSWREPLILTCSLLHEGRPEHVLSILQSALATVPLNWNGYPPDLVSLLILCLAEASSLVADPARAFALSVNKMVWAMYRLWYFLRDELHWLKPLARAYHTAGESWPGVQEAILEVDKYTSTPRLHTESYLAFSATMPEEQRYGEYVGRIRRGEVSPALPLVANLRGIWGSEHSRRLEQELLECIDPSDECLALAVALLMVDDDSTKIPPDRLIDLLPEDLRDSDEARKLASSTQSAVSSDAGLRLLSFALLRARPHLFLDTYIFTAFRPSEPKTDAARTRVLLDALASHPRMQEHSFIATTGAFFRSTALLDLYLDAWRKDPDIAVRTASERVRYWNEGLSHVIDWGYANSASENVLAYASALSLRQWPKASPEQFVNETINVVHPSGRPSRSEPNWHIIENLRGSPLLRLPPSARIACVERIQQLFPEHQIEIGLTLLSVGAEAPKDPATNAGIQDKFTSILESAFERRPLLALYFAPSRIQSWLRILRANRSASNATAIILRDVRSERDLQRLLVIGLRAKHFEQALVWRPFLRKVYDESSSNKLRIQAAIGLEDPDLLRQMQQTENDDPALQAALDLLDARDNLLRVGKPRRAVVRLAGTRVGSLTELSDGTIRFAYDPAYLARPDAPPVAPTLPLRSEPYDTQGLHPIFANLLPQGWLLDLDLRKYQLNPGDQFGLLLATGRDTIGAIEILPEP